LVSLDGFRWDYRDMVETPALDGLARRGVAGNLRPAFPSKTFPVHHTIATGLHPNHHGVVGNTMYDPVLDARFSMGNKDAVGDGRWWGGEPIWVTAEKAGLIAATYFWPGSEAEIGGIRPSHWKKYDGEVPGEDRVDQILEWLGLPSARRPSFLTLYFSDVDGAGHRFGPEADETMAAVRGVDQYLSRLVIGLESLGLTDSVNIVIISDHGMSQLANDRVVYVDDYIDVSRAGVLSLGQYVALWPDQADIDSIFRKLDGVHPALTVFRRGSIPERFHLDGNRRTPPIIGVVETGWSVSTRSWAEDRKDPFSGGGHGYDNEDPNMTGIFIASGPAFASRVSVQTLNAVDVYNLLAISIGVEPAPNDGDVSMLVRILKPPGR
ncbi:MAG: ectonucleotide pyrophosphatase/phosphodiesterase, partial [Rhodothermia bacterium]